MHLIVRSALSLNKICILFRKTKMINLKLNPNPYRPGRRSVSVSDWPEITYFSKLISNIFRLVDRGNDPRHGIWNNPVCLVCQRTILSEFTQSRRLQNRKQNMCRHLNTSERKWRQPQLQLHFVTKFLSLIHI